MRILVTNDDGIQAPGLGALRRTLAELGEVITIAPDRPRSACGHAVTLHKPLRLTPVELAGGGPGYMSNGTPSDCVALGVSRYMGGPPDLVVSGINVGPNLGFDLTYSGTVAAAMEGAICGLPSIAISIASYQATDLESAARFARYLSEAVLARGLPRDCFLNVNVPAVPGPQIAGVAITRQGRLMYEGRIERRTDPRGGEYYWFSGVPANQAGQPGTDIDAISRNLVSVTPIRLDLTDHTLVEELARWGLQWPG